MCPYIWLVLNTTLLLLLCNCTLAALNNQTASYHVEVTTQYSQIVPLFISNISNLTNTTNTLIPSNRTAITYKQDVPAVQLQQQQQQTKTANQKVPSKRNITENINTSSASAYSSSAAAAASAAYAQTPAGIFLANYNSQQNVLQLVRNIDARLRNIRNVEMRVATIQEIFDSMHFTSSSAVLGSLSLNKNYTDVPQKQPTSSVASTLQHDLQIFSKRLMKKLQKATHVVLDLRKFMSENITEYMLQHHMPQADFGEDDDNVDDDDDDDIEDADDDEELDEHDFNIEIDEQDSLAINSNKAHNRPSMHLYFNTLIQTCASNSNQDEADVLQSQSQSQPQTQRLSIGQTYNKQQIQILNYHKTETETQQQQQHFADHFYYMQQHELNARVRAKIESLRNAVEHFDMSFNVRMQTGGNAKMKFLGNHFKHIYFLSRSDHASDLTERYYYDLNFRHLYVSAIKNKYVLLLIDVGSAMNVELLELTKTFVSNVLQLLSNTDYISIITVADVAKSMHLEIFTNGGENSRGIYLATRTHKEEILNFVHSLGIAKALTNHSLGFEYAFEMLERLQNDSLINIQNPIEFVYVTRGLLTNLSDAMHVLNVIASGQSKLKQPIVINTCAVVLDEKRIMYEKQFLTDIAAQNYTKYDIKVEDWYNEEDDDEDSSLIGKFFVLTKMHPDTSMRASTAIFENAFEERYLMQSIDVLPPFVDAYSKEALVAITHAVAPFGVVGVNLYLADLIEDVVNYHQQDQNANKHEFVYAFLIDRSGITIAHPAFPRPITQIQTPFPVDIGFLENSTDFANIRKRMLQEENGEISTTVYLRNNRKNESMDRTYHWQSVLGIYILCLVSTTKRDSYNSTTTTSADIVNKVTLQLPTTIPLQRFAAKDNMPPLSTSQLFQHTTEYEYMPSVDLLYHRLDLIPPPNKQICRYFRQIATLDAATLFLSSSAFESPFTFLQNNRLSNQHTQIRIVESIMAYLKDSTGLLANPGLRSPIRHEVNALYSAMQHLKKRHQDARGLLKHYIIRRYIATVNGVLQVYPGCLLSNNYDATRRPWFRKAMQQPGKIVTTEPYLDAGGAGYIITIAHTIFEGKANALHSIERDQPVAIVALDLPYAYYYKMILDTTPLCQQNNIKCLLFENEGYLIAHPSMLEPSTPLKNQRRPHEHLTHKESYLANDILNHKTLVRKLACANYQNRTLQRYYVFNTSLSEILTNVVHGERTKYGIALVRGSNIFAAVLNSTCDGGAFCPCSTIDRICLNCNRMDQMDCECPCECPMEADVFADESLEQLDATPFSNYTQQYAYCEPVGEHFLALPATANDHNLLRACVSINCDVYGTQSECLAVMACEWCQQDLDGNGFTAAFCTSQASCFNGVLSALNPYGDMDDVDIIVAHGFNPGQKQNSYSAFGPVGGAIVVLGIVIGFAIYCYRHNLDSPAQDQFYIDSMQEDNYGLPLSRFNFDDCQAHDEPPGNGGYDHPSAQRNLIHPADISPYHVSTGSSYRRPPNGESDHGYSTMTPHEDSSDHQCFTLAEPLLLNDKRNSKSDTMSISTSISSPTNRHQQSQHYHNPYLGTQQAPLLPPPTSTTKESRYNLTSPKKFHSSATPSPARVYEQTTLPLNDTLEDQTISSHYILAPVTVHRHMETSES